MSFETWLAFAAASARRVRSTPMAQRRFDVAGGALLSTAGIRALFARRSGAAA